MNPLVSVVISTYNYGRFLAETINSVLGQTVRNAEVVVVDDGSTDDTPQVIRPYLINPRVYYHRIEHKGVVAAKNLGIRSARGSFVAFLDADDFWLPTKLARQLELFRRDPDLGVVYARRLLIDEQGYELEEHEQPALHRGMILDRIFQTNFICFSSAVVARRVFDQVGLLEEGTSPSDDYDLWLRVARHYCFDYVDQPMVGYRLGHASLSRREARLEVVLRIMRRFLDSHGGRECLSPSAIRRAFADTYCTRALGQREQSRLAALRWYGHALAHAPLWGPAWKGLASLGLPEPARRQLRRLLGRRENWSQRQRVSTTPCNGPVSIHCAGSV
jgi:glycosyltransferase involved in cell wall biosynthesis